MSGRHSRKCFVFNYNNITVYPRKKNKYSDGNSFATVARRSEFRIKTITVSETDRHYYHCHRPRITSER